MPELPGCFLLHTRDLKRVTAMSAPVASSSSAPAASSSASGDALRFLNHCLSNAVQVHYLVVASMQDGDWRTSSLLGDEAQTYMRALLHAYGSSSALRRQLISGDALYYLQSLTDEATRVDFIRVAAAPAFPFAAS